MDATETRARLLEDVRRLAERETDEVPAELSAREERGPGHSRDTNLAYEPVRERDVIVESERSDVAKHVVRALRRVWAEARGIERTHEAIAPRAVVGREPLVERRVHP